jgi:hypothetical protein
MVRNDRGIVALGTKELIKETKKLKSISNGQVIEDIQEIKTE